MYCLFEVCVLLFDACFMCIELSRLFVTDFEKVLLPRLFVQWCITGQRASVGADRNIYFFNYEFL